jgi:hypothetical protein
LYGIRDEKGSFTKYYNDSLRLYCARVEAGRKVAFSRHLLNKEIMAFFYVFDANCVSKGDEDERDRTRGLEH